MCRQNKSDSIHLEHVRRYKDLINYW